MSQHISAETIASVPGLEEYEVGPVLGEGSFGVVRKAVVRTSRKEVALKIINKALLDKPAMRNLDREVKILQMLNHPSIVNLVTVVDTSNVQYLVLEYCGGGDMYDYVVRMGRLSEELVHKYFVQILSALDYCHKNNIVHRDLKPENLLLSDDLETVKVSDFGLGNRAGPRELLYTLCGTINYAAPELFTQKNGYSGAPVDMWSLGVVLHVLVCGYLPFDNGTVLFTDVEIDLPDFLTTDCKSLIRSLLSVQPERRMAMAQALTHPWVIRNHPGNNGNSTGANSTANVTSGNNNTSNGTTGNSANAPKTAVDGGDRGTAGKEPNDGGQPTDAGKEAAPTASTVPSENINIPRIETDGGEQGDANSLASIGGSPVAFINIRGTGFIKQREETVRKQRENLRREAMRQAKHASRGGTLDDRIISAAKEALNIVNRLTTLVQSGEVVTDHASVIEALKAEVALLVKFVALQVVKRDDNNPESNKAALASLSKQIETGSNYMIGVCKSCFGQPNISQTRDVQRDTARDLCGAIGSLISQQVDKDRILKTARTALLCIMRVQDMHSADMRYSQNRNPMAFNLATQFARKANANFKDFALVRASAYTDERLRVAVTAASEEVEVAMEQMILTAKEWIEQENNKNATPVRSDETSEARNLADALGRLVDLIVQDDTSDKGGDSVAATSDRPATSTTSTLMQGWLMKKKKGEWERRWLVLTMATLTCFESDDTAEQPEAVVTLDSFTTITTESPEATEFSVASMDVQLALNSKSVAERSVWQAALAGALAKSIATETDKARMERMQRSPSLNDLEEDDGEGQDAAPALGSSIMPVSLLNVPENKKTKRMSVYEKFKSFTKKPDKDEKQRRQSMSAATPPPNFDSYGPREKQRPLSPGRRSRGASPPRNIPEEDEQEPVTHTAGTLPADLGQAHSAIRALESAVAERDKLIGDLMNQLREARSQNSGKVKAESSGAGATADALALEVETLRKQLDENERERKELERKLATSERARKLLHAVVETR